MDLALAATVFGLVFVAELPDKTALATLVLSTRYRPLTVWYGALAAFALQCGIAVAAGGLLSLLPARPVQFAAAALFAAGAVLAFRGGHDEAGARDDLPAVPARNGFLAALGVLFLAEWGDFTQLATATLAARHADPLSVFVGAFAALGTVAALAATLGRTLLDRLPLAAVRRVAGGLFALVAVVTAVGAVRG